MSMILIDSRNDAAAMAMARRVLDTFPDRITPTHIHAAKYALKYTGEQLDRMHALFSAIQPRPSVKHGLLRTARKFSRISAQLDEHDAEIRRLTL